MDEETSVNKNAVPDSDSEKNKETSPEKGLNRRTFLKGAGAGTAIALTGALSRASADNGPITLGASAALTGKYAHSGTKMVEGYQLWVDQINSTGSVLDNSNGGLLGREIEFVYYDDQSDPSRAVNLYRRLIFRDEVDLLMGPYSSAVSTSVIPIIENNRRACVMSMMSDTSVLAKRNVSYITQSIAPASTYARGAIEVGANRGARSMAVVYEDTAFPTAISRGHVPFAEEKGIEVVHNEAFPKEINDYTSVLNKVKDKNPDIVMGAGYTPDAIGLTKAAQSVNLEADIFVWVIGGTLPAYHEAVGDAARGITGDLFWAPYSKVPHNQEFIDAFMSKFSEQYDSPNQIDYHSPGGYAGCLVMEQAVRNVGGLNQKAIARELHEIELGIPFANGVYKVNEKGIQIGQAPSLGQWQQQNGSMDVEAVWPSQYATADPLYPHPGWM